MDRDHMYLLSGRSSFNVWSWVLVSVCLYFRLSGALSYAVAIGSLLWIFTFPSLMDSIRLSEGDTNDCALKIPASAWDSGTDIMDSG